MSHCLSTQVTTKERNRLWRMTNHLNTIEKSKLLLSKSGGKSHISQNYLDCQQKKPPVHMDSIGMFFTEVRLAAVVSLDCSGCSVTLTHGWLATCHDNVPWLTATWCQLSSNNFLWLTSQLNLQQPPVGQLSQFLCLTGCPYWEALGGSPFNKLPLLTYQLPLQAYWFSYPP